MDLIAEIKSRTDIIQIVSAHVPLKKAGKDYKARCPFHTEKTPSFTVSAEKQLFYCFGCGTGGDLIRFVSLIEKIDTKEAIHRLADRLGIVRQQRGDARSAPAEPLRRALEMATLYYEAALAAPVGAGARAYLANRKMPDEIVKKFRIGYAPDRQDALTARLLEKGVPEEILIEVGLTARREDRGNRLQDRFRDRLMFPILDGGGHVMGFSGRVIRNEDRRPKYLNSAENSLFHKGTLLYGYPTAKDMVGRDTPPVLVEGQMDVVYAQTAGLAAMAALGTALTDTQADLLSRFRQPVLLAYDADAAGRKAAIRAAAKLLARDVEIGVVSFPEGCDPAELVERGETAKLREAAGNPQDAFKFLVDTALSLHPDRREASRVVGEIGAGIRDAILRQRMVQAFADGFGLSPSVASDLMRSSASAPTGAGEGSTGAMDRSEALLLGEGLARMEWTVIGVAIARVDLMALAYAQIDDDFSDPHARLVWDVLAAQYERRHELDMDEVLAAFADHPKVLERLTQIRMRSMPETNLPAQGYKDLLMRLRRARLKRQIDALHARLKSAEASKDRDAVKVLLDEDRALQKRLSAIAKG